MSINKKKKKAEVCSTISPPLDSLSSAQSDRLDSLSPTVSVDFLWPQGSSASTSLALHQHEHTRTHTLTEAQSAQCLWGGTDRDLQPGPALPSGLRVEEMPSILGMLVCCSSMCCVTFHVWRPQTNISSQRSVWPLKQIAESHRQADRWTGRQTGRWTEKCVLREQKKQKLLWLQGCSLLQWFPDGPHLKPVVMRRPLSFSRINTEAPNAPHLTVTRWSRGKHSQLVASCNNTHNSLFANERIRR